MIDLNQILQIKPSEFAISFSVESYDEINECVNVYAFPSPTKSSEKIGSVVDNCFRPKPLWAYLCSVRSKPETHTHEFSTNFHDICTHDVTTSSHGSISETIYSSIILRLFRNGKWLSCWQFKCWTNRMIAQEWTIILSNIRKKNCWKLPKSLRCRKAHNFQTIKYIDSKFSYHKLKTYWRYYWI